MAVETGLAVSDVLLTEPSPTSALVRARSVLYSVGVEATHIPTLRWITASDEGARAAMAVRSASNGCFAARSDDQSSHLSLGDRHRVSGPGGMGRGMHAGCRGWYPVGVEVGAGDFGEDLAGCPAGRHPFTCGPVGTGGPGEDGVADGADDRGDLGEVDGTCRGVHAEAVGGVAAETHLNVVGPVGRVEVGVVGGWQVDGRSCRR